MTSYPSPIAGIDPETLKEILREAISNIRPDVVDRLIKEFEEERERHDQDR